MRTPPRILIADDNPDNLDIFQTRLAAQGYETLVAKDGEEALDKATEQTPDLILLDVMMPRMDGFEVCRRLKDPSRPFVPIIMVTAMAESKDIIAGLEAGADEYLAKPVDQAALVARVKSMLRIKALHDTVQEQTARIEAQSVELEEWNRTLQKRVTEQLGELERVARLKKFLPPQLAELIVSSNGEKLLESHRREITVAFGDLRGFTAFAETAEPEEVIGVLQEYYSALCCLIHQFQGTLQHFTGDGLMVFFNDPVPCSDPAARAVRMAVAMRQRVNELGGTWRKLGYELDFGIGIAEGYATLGKIGFEGQFTYTAIGPVANLAARLCAEARGGQILISRRVFALVEDFVETEPVGELVLKGFHKPVLAFDVMRLKSVEAKVE
jgi:class 3 adenylate cyclase/CheY-like chemotaxis protein